MNICVAGAGYVGLITSLCFAHLGHNIHCVDIDSKKIDQLKNGITPFYEPEAEYLLRVSLEKQTICFSTNLPKSIEKADIIFIATGTPLLENGELDLKQVQSATIAIGKNLDDSRFRVIVNKSTVPVGAGNWVEMLIEEGIRKKNNKDQQPLFAVASNPEFLREGSAIHDTLYPDRIIIGSSEVKAISTLKELYKPILEQSFNPPTRINPDNIEKKQIPLLITDTTSAELIKYASNAFLATKISFINEISTICEKVGANVKDVATGIGMDSRIGIQFLEAGIGWGGSCFGRDLLAIISTAKEYGFNPSLIESTITVNQQQRKRILKKIQHALKILKGKTIGILGLAFKPNTDDLRDSPSIEIIQQLLKRGAKVKAYDPIAMDNCQETFPELKIKYAHNAMELAKKCDAVVILTSWDEFRYFNLTKAKTAMVSPIIIDARNILNSEEVIKKGFTYYSVGKLTEKV